MFADTLVSKSCSEGTNMFYLSSGVLFVGNRCKVRNSFLENLRKKAEDIEYPENEIL